MSHYYDFDKELKSNIKEINHFFKNKNFQFKTDNGVFSKKGFDFGSNLLINSVELKKTDRVLDVGCGYGAIGIPLSVHYGSTIDMVDINERAVDLCKVNIDLNNSLKNYVFLSNIYDEVVEVYNVIISNPPIRAGKNVVHNIISGAYNKLLPNGELYIVIQKKQGASSAIEKMKEVYKNCLIVSKKKGYFVLKSKKIVEE